MTSLALRSPEVLLSNLNRVALELHGAIAMLGKPALCEQLTAVMRRLFIADLLSHQWIIAIGGSQGAGKTTLVRLMYDLDQLAAEDQWLPANEGRGECMPVLLLEDDTIAEPQGYLRCLVPTTTDMLMPMRYQIFDKPVLAAEFRIATSGRSTDTLLPVLRLPRRYFSAPDQAFLLLPGYENRHQENSDWQELMRQALVGAPASIIVTDQTRLANAQQREILKDMQANELSGTQPIVIVSKTENIAGAPDKQQALRATAGDVFEIAPQQQERFIICSGTAPEHVAHWRPALAQALEQLTTSSGQARQRQLDHLAKLLSHDLTTVLADIRMAFTLHAGGGTDAHNHELLREFLDTFDMSRDRLRDEYQRGLNDALTSHFGRAWKQLDQVLIDGHEGFLNKAAGLFATVGEQRQRVLTEIQAAWDSDGPFALRHVDVLGAVTAKKLGRPTPVTLLGAPDAGPPAARQLACLGYTDAHGQPVTWKEPSEATRHNLAIVFYPERDDDGRAGHSTKDMTASIKLLPALTLEFGRIGSLFPQGLGVDPSTLTLAQETDLTTAAQRVQQDFAMLSTTGSNIVKGLAIMLAIDGAADGKIDTIPALLSMLGLGGDGASVATGGVGAGAGALAGAVTGMVAAGLLTYAVLQEVKRQDNQARDAAQGALLGIKERHYAHYLEHFDIMMDHVRDTMQQRLSLRYRLDEALMRRDRLAKALADVFSLKLDLEEQLGRGGHAMALVAPA